MHHAYQTALVTGASSGIGERLARRLAADGCDLVILARRTGRLEALAAELRGAHRVGVEVLTADLTSAAGLAAAQARLSNPGRPIELLVNNAGFGSSGLFADLPASRAEDQVRLNVMAVVQLTHAALPGMLRCGHGGVLNVSSVAGFVPSPGAATYGATKAFVTSFSESLAAEARLSDPGRPVELLVNNAGFGASGWFADVPAGRAEDQIRLNVTAVVRLTHAALPGMLRRGHGGVLNVSSVAGFVPSPGAATYGATKAFVTSFSESLAAEVKGRGVHVTALCPGFTRTDGRGRSGIGPAALAWLDADQVARAGLDAVAAGRVLAVPGAQYKSVVSLTRVVPRAVVRSAAAAVRRNSVG